MPPSSVRKEKATAVAAALQPKVFLIGLKRAVADLIYVPPAKKRNMPAAITIHQP